MNKSAFWPIQQKFVDTGIDEQRWVSRLSTDPGACWDTGDRAAFINHQPLSFGQFSYGRMIQTSQTANKIPTPTTLPIIFLNCLANCTKPKNPRYLNAHTTVFPYLWPCQRERRKCFLCHHQPIRFSLGHRTRARELDRWVYWSLPWLSSQWRCSPPAGGVYCYQPVNTTMDTFVILVYYTVFVTYSLKTIEIKY